MGILEELTGVHNDPQTQPFAARSGSVISRQAASKAGNERM